MKRDKQPILIITRNYPPKTGGLETFSYNLIKSFENDGSVTVFKITLSKGNAHLVWFFPYVLLQSLILITRHKIRRVHLCDGVLAPVGHLLKRLLSVHLSITLHGLDITYDRPIYQLLVPKCIMACDKVVCVSCSTYHEVVSKGVPKEKCCVIGNGVNPEDFECKMTHEEISRSMCRRIGVSLDSKTVLLTVGRLVKRKGVAWFLNNVFPELKAHYIYVIVGSGLEDKEIREIIKRRGYQGRVILLSGLTSAERNTLYHGADLFLMPNIVVPGDVEGFGITAIEASVCGLPVIASDLQGIKDAVIEGGTGTLVAAGDVGGFIDRIENSDFDSVVVQACTVENYSWATSYAKYKNVIL